MYYIRCTNMDFKIKCFTWSIFQILCTQVKTRPIALSEDGEHKELLTTALETGKRGYRGVKSINKAYYIFPLKSKCRELQA